MLFACLDESYTKSPVDTPYYVVAGFVGEQERWDIFESLWRDSMKRLRITRVGCHASDCESGWKEYKHMSPEKRREIQHSLIVDIAVSGIYGVVSAINMDAYRRVKDSLSGFVDPEGRQYMAGPVLAVKQCAQLSCVATQNATREPITFYVDQNREFGKRAQAWYEMARNNPDDHHRLRYGPYYERDRKEQLGLQAADMLAYSYLRHLRGVPVWQWDDLQRVVKMSEFVTETPFWDTLEQNFEEAARAKGL